MIQEIIMIGVVFNMKKLGMILGAFGFLLFAITEYILSIFICSWLSYLLGILGILLMMSSVKLISIKN